MFANFNVGDTAVVGSYENGKSPYGAYDMAGNVWEWVADWYSDTYYGRSPAENLPRPASVEMCVLRCGSWGLVASVLALLIVMQEIRLRAVWTLASGAKDANI